MEDSWSIQARERMVAEQLAERGIRSERVLEAMRSVPRHIFVSPELQKDAYQDGPLPIGNGQTISQPYIVALMTQLLALNGGERVLEIGTGSGYQAAILGHLAGEVHTIERYPNLADHARQILQNLGLENVQVHTGDGSLGLPEFAPYKCILVTAGAPGATQALLEQLTDGGRMVIPVGVRGSQRLEVWERTGRGFDSEVILPVAFVPLVGAGGWKGEWKES